MATVIRLLETTLIRVGNEEYAREYHSYGLSLDHSMNKLRPVEAAVLALLQKCLKSWKRSP